MYKTRIDLVHGELAASRHGTSEWRALSSASAASTIRRVAVVLGGQIDVESHEGSLLQL